jgi:cytochrome c5
MDDRDLIADAIGVRKHGRDQWEWVRKNPSAHQKQLDKAYWMADAALAAIGDRLLPPNCDTCHNTGMVTRGIPNGIAVVSTACPDCGRRQVAMNREANG